MSLSQVLEGTFDEVSAELSTRAEELRAYGKLRLIVVVDEAVLPDYDTVLAELFEAADALEASPGKPHSDPHEAQIARLITEKYRKQGLEI